MEKYTHLVYWVLLTILAVLVVCLIFRKDGVSDESVEHTTDTLFVYRTDTIVVTDVKYLTQKKKDTIYIDTKKDSIIALPVMQKHYGEKDLFDVWVSGVEPLGVDSVKVYPKTEYCIITNEIIKTNENKRPELYFFGGLDVAGSKVMPRLGVSIKTANDWLISPEIGLFDNSVVYGVSVGKKIKF